METSVLEIGELARRAAVPVKTLRYWSDVGLVPPAGRTAAGYRLYGDAALGRLRLIRRALAMGFSVTDLAVVLAERDRGGAPCRKVRHLLATRLDELDRRIVDLTTLRREMRRLLGDWDTRLKAAAPGGRAHLLEGLPAAPRRPERRRSTIGHRHG
jgi:DNA-binding transcriptional MerR regulator